MKTALVTGGNRGIGRAIALELSASGADVLVSGRRADLLKDLVAEIEALGRNAAALAIDTLQRQRQQQPTESSRAARAGQVLRLLEVAKEEPQMLL